MRRQALVAAGPFLTVSITAIAAVTPGYSRRADTISALATPDRPLRTLAVAALVTYGVLVVAGAAAVRRAAVARLVRVHGLATVVTALVAKHGAFTASVPNVVHVVAAVVAGASLVAAMVTNGHRRCAAAAAVLATAFHLAWGTDVYGALERLLVLLGVVWLTAVAARTAPRSC